MIELTGNVVEEDLVQLTGYVNTLSSRLSTIVFDIHSAQFEPEISSLFTKLKNQYERNKIKFLIVTPEIIGADSARFRDAIVSLKTPESDRILEIMDVEADIARAEKAVAQARNTLVTVLGIKPAAEPGAPVSDAEVDRAFEALEERNRQLLQLFRTMSAEINHLEQEGATSVLPNSEDQLAVAVAEGKRRALDIIRSKKLLES